MTTQRSDLFILDGQTLRVFPFPLDELGSPWSVSSRPSLTLMSTGCWRGYIATWSLRDGRLVLINVEALSKDTLKLVTMEDLFGVPDLRPTGSLGICVRPRGSPSTRIRSKLRA